MGRPGAGKSLCALVLGWESGNNKPAVQDANIANPSSKEMRWEIPIWVSSLVRRVRLGRLAQLSERAIQAALSELAVCVISSVRHPIYDLRYIL